MVRSELGRRLAAMCLVSLALQGVALAAPRPRVGVIPFTALDPSASDLAKRLSEQVTRDLAGRQAALELLGGAASSQPASTRANPEIDASLKEGKSQLADLRFDKAAVSLKRGIELALLDVATLDVPALLEAHVNLAVALFRQGEEKDAQAALATVARLDSEYSLPEGRFPPIFVREFEKARKRVAKAPTGSLSIEGPRGATAFVDGRDLGMVPVQEDDLRSGPHFVQVVGVKGERFGQRVEVSKGLTRVKAVFGGTAPAKPLALALSAQLDAATGAKLLALARASGADELLLGVVAKNEDGTHTLGAGLYSQQDAAVRKFPLLKLDAKTVVALGDRLETRLLEPGLTESFPVILIPPPEKKQVVLDETLDVSAVGASRVALKPDPTGERLRALDRKSVMDGDPLTQSTPSQPEVSGGIPWWVWVAGGVATAAIAGGTYYGVSQAGRPVTGTVSARW